MALQTFVTFQATILPPVNCFSHDKNSFSAKLEALAPNICAIKPPLETLGSLPTV